MKRIPKYEVLNSLAESESSAFLFTDGEKKFALRTTRKEEVMDDIGNVKPFWMIMSVVAVILCLIFGVFEALWAQNAILSLLDPLGLGAVNQTVISLIGVGLSLFGMFMGHIFAESLHSSVHHVTGRRSQNIGFSFFFSLVGLIAYLAFQYYLVQAAGGGLQEFGSFQIIAVVVALLEILVGVLILGKALSYLLLFFINLKLGIISSNLRKNSRNANNYYRDYRSLRDQYNVENPTQEQLELEGNPNIRRAIAYFGGIELPEQQQPIQHSESQPQATLNSVQPTAKTREDDDKSSVIEQDVITFLDDDNITL